MSVIPATIIRGLNGPSSNEEYHKNSTHYSSSQIKTLFWDQDKFHNEYILGNKQPMKQSDGLILGTLIHTRLLEGHLYDNQVAVCPEFTKRGHAFKNFEAANPGKLCISGGQALQLENMEKAYKANKTAVNLIDNCKTEVTIGSEILGIPVKIRCDGLDIENGRIVDIKSTAYSVEIDVFRQNAYSQMLSYDISAAFYTMAAEQEFGKPFDFYYVAISKSEYKCEVFKSSQTSLINGRNKIFKALEKLNYFRVHGQWPDTGIKKSTSNIGDYEIREL